MGAPFTAGCTVQFAYLLTENVYYARLRVVDLSGISTAYDLAVGDVVFLDMMSSGSAPGTVARYTVSLIELVEGQDVQLNLTWSGAFEPVDPNEAAGLAGYVSRPSSKNGLVWHPPYYQVNVPEYVVSGARNAESFVIIENLAKGDQVRQKFNFTAADAATSFTTGDVVALDATGKLIKADPTDFAKMPAVGVVLKATATAGEYEVQTAGTLAVAGVTFTPGKFVWVGTTGLTASMADVPPSGVLQQAGLALTTTTISLALPGLVVTK